VRITCREADPQTIISVFRHRYAQYYDAYYTEKDRDGECDLIEASFRRFGHVPGTIPDLACGTGNQGLGLAARVLTM